MLTLQGPLMAMGGDDAVRSGVNSTVEATMWWGKELYSSGKPTPHDFTRCHFGVSNLGGAKMAPFSTDKQYLSNIWSLRGTLGWH